MAFDPNSIPNDLRPLNLTRTVAEEPRGMPMTTPGRNVEGIYTNSARDASSASMSVYYPVTVSDTGYVGMGYGNASPGVASICSPMQLPVGHTGLNPAVGFGYSPNMGIWVGGGNAVGQAGNDMLAGLGYSPNLGNRSGGSPAEQTSNDMETAFAFSPNLGNRVGGNASDQASDEGGEDSVSGKKIKFLCSYGGKILPRPSDGMLRYVGGQTRIISVMRDVNFNELVQKMADSYGQPVVIKYQLPDEDLDALVSVSCPDDLDNMMDEYEKLVERSPDGLAKLRVFLFSTSDLDPSGAGQFEDLHDSGGQRYVEAVNGIFEGAGGGVTRKESIASATSTQNSDYSGTEAADSLVVYQGDVSAPPSTSILSPKGESDTTNDNALRMVCVDPNPAGYTDASAISLGIPVAKSPPQSPSSQIEGEMVRSVPLTVPQQQMGIDMQQQGVKLPPSTRYLHTYVNPRQDVMSHAGYMQLPPQMGFPNPQLLGAAGSVFAQQQFQDNTAGTHQFIPAMHMTMNPSMSHVGMRPTMVQPMMHMQSRFDHYQDESSFGPRVVQFPVNQSYSTYRAQVPSNLVGGGYGWHQVPQPDHVLLPNQQVMFPEKISRFEDCLLCEKALPHAHSDTLVQGKSDNDASSASGSNSIYHSLRPEDIMRAQPANRVMVTGALGEGIAEQGAGACPGFLGHMDQVKMSPSEAIAFSQNLDTQHENERIILQTRDNFDHPMRPVTTGMIGFPSDLPSAYGVPTVAIPQNTHENAAQQHSLPAQYQVKQEVLANKPMNSDAPPFKGMPHNCLVRESPKEYSSRFPGMVPKEDTSIEHLIPIDEMMDTLGIYSPESFVYPEQGKSPVDEVKKEDLFNHIPQQTAGRELPLDTAYSKPSIPLDSGYMKPTEMVPCPTSTEVPYVHHFLPAESCEVSQSHNMGNFGGVCHLGSDDILYGNPAFSGIESSYVKYKIQPVGEWKDDTTEFQRKMVPGDLEAIPLDGNMTSLSPCSRTLDVQDSTNSLFSNQDPWNMRQDSHFLAKPNKIPTNKEAFGAQEYFGESQLVNIGEVNSGMLLDDRVHQKLSNENKDSTSDHGHSGRGQKLSDNCSAEELVKQELKAVAEDVAASVLRPSTPTNPELSLHETNEYAYVASQDRGVPNSNVEIQYTAKAEHNRPKLPEKGSFGFPVSDGIGRLQIIKNSDLEELRELGSGTFGTVYHGKWRGSDVAIKRINDRCFAGKASEQERMRDDFWNEAIKLADLHHPNVVAFYGVVLDGPGGSVATVTEYMVNGSLRNSLQKNERILDKRKRLLIAMDVAFGMEYLHGKNIVHFDLKSDNLLVNLRDPHRPICKVGDLGLSKVKCKTLISGGVRGTLPWMAPELLNGSSSLVSEKVDVFSFGIVLWELLTGEEPYADLHYGAIIGGIVSNTLRPPVPESCDPDWRSLMESCWSSEPSERPNFTQIVNELRSTASKLPQKDKPHNNTPA